ncbi:MAG: hypothetical protein JSS89_14025 [Bacteroidetes bacterium]|nr:hypothetical protein [Bacteroidota bacterium]
MSERQDWWTRRSDGDIAEAYAHIQEFEADAQEIIRGEFERRGLDPAHPVPPSKAELRELMKERSAVAVQSYLYPTSPVALVRLIGMACLVSSVGSFSVLTDDLVTARDYPDAVSILLAITSTVVFTWVLCAAIAAFRPTARAWTILTSFLTWSVVSAGIQTLLSIARLVLESESQVSFDAALGFEDGGWVALRRAGITVIFGVFWFIGLATMFRPDVQAYMGVSLFRRFMAPVFMKFIVFIGVALTIGMIWLRTR